MHGLDVIIRRNQEAAINELGAEPVTNGALTLKAYGIVTACTGWYTIENAILARASCARRKSEREG